MSDLLDTLLSPEQRAACRAPIQSARTLPRQAFTSDRFYQLETERIFSRHWAAIGFNAQLAATGDLLPMELCGLPLLITRAEDDQIRVFHNIVPYDGCLAAIAPAHDQREIVTPYHGWRYSLAGKLLSTPRWDGSWQTAPASLAEKRGDLIEVRSASWGPVLFVDLSGEAPEFSQHITPLQRITTDWRVDALNISRNEHGSPLLDPEDLATNWKTHYENWGINVLHESFVHDFYAASPEVPRLSPDGRKTCEDYIDGSFMALRYVFTQFQHTYPQFPFPHLGHTADQPPTYGYFGSLFPNLHVGIFAQLVHLIIALPAGPGRTHTLRAQFYARDAATSAEQLQARKDALNAFHQGGLEDGRITEAIQRARRSPAFDSQYYSPFWDAMHHRFTQQVLDALEQQ